MSRLAIALMMVAVSGPMICWTHLCVSDAPDGGLGVFSKSGRYLGNLVWAAQPSATATPEPSPASPTPTPLASCRQRCEDGGGEAATTGAVCECARLTPAGMRTWRIPQEPVQEAVTQVPCAKFTAHKPNVSYKDLRMSVNGAVLPKCP